MENVRRLRLDVDGARVFGRADFNDSRRFPNHAKYVLSGHVRVREVDVEEDAHDVEVLKEKVCVWVFCPSKTGGAVGDDDDWGVWQKIERRRTSDDDDDAAPQTTRVRGAKVFSFFAPKGCPSDDATMFRSQFKMDECIGPWTVCSSNADNDEKEKAKKEQICLVLTGTSGAGKSTVAKSLSAKKWTVVNQDTIGSYCERECFRKKADQCVMKAKHGLMLGRHVVIDRTNMSIEQRKKFVDAVEFVRMNDSSGDANIRLVSLYLDLDVSVTTSRVARRKNHEGKVEGREGVEIVHKQLYSRDSSTPRKSEGFDVCFRCKTPVKVEVAVGKIKSMTGHNLPPFPAEWDGTQKPPVSVLHLAQPPPKKTQSEENTGDDDKRKKTKHTGFFLDGLLQKQSDPERECSKEELLTINDSCFAIKDKFPKAKFHALVLPRSPKFKHPFDLFKEDFGDDSNERQYVWNQMVRVAFDIVKDQEQKLPQGTKFRVGFHLKPSMQPAHLHVISQDFVSEKLTTKQHWHTFTNDGFFIDFFKAMTMTRGWDDSRCEQIVKSSDLRCHKCHASCPNMPQLKRHIFECRAPQIGYTHDELVKLSMHHHQQEQQQQQQQQQQQPRGEALLHKIFSSSNKDDMDI
jgi:aprataxin